MRKIIFDIIAQYLMWTCDLTHLLPEPYDETIQTKVFIPLIGYHCPFATWAFQIDEKFGSNRWLVKKP
jgi:hypothetical protein